MCCEAGLAPLNSVFSAPATAIPRITQTLLARKSHQELSWDLDLSDNIIGFNNLYKTDKEVP